MVLKPYRERSRWHDMEIEIDDGRMVAVTKLGVFPKRAFWVNDELYQEYLNEGRKPVK